jgi:putative inorganic carbon (hco3(-)) transporter
MNLVPVTAGAETMVQRRRQSMRAQLVVGLAVSLAIGAVWVGIPSIYLILGVALAPIAIVTVLRAPFLLCISFISLSFFRLHELYTPLEALHLPFILALASFGVLAVLLVFRRIRPYWRPELTVLGLFAALATFGIAFAVDRPGALAFWLDSFSKTVLMVYAIAWCVRGPGELVLAAKLFILCGIAVAAVAVWNATHGIGLVEGTRVTIPGAAHGALTDPNDLALVLLFPMSFALSYLGAPRIGFLGRLLGLAGTIIVLWAILATQSRGGLLGLAAVFAVFASRWIRSRAILLTIGIAAAFALYGADNIAERQSGGAAEAGLGDSANERLDTWTAAIRMAGDHPLTGVGLNGFAPIFYFYTDHWEGIDRAVHSTWFGVLAEIGPLGLILFVAMVVMTIRRSLRTLKRLDELRRRRIAVDPEIYALALAIVAGLAGFVVSGSFLTQAYTWPIYVLTALALSMTRFGEAAGSETSIAPG